MATNSPKSRNSTTGLFSSGKTLCPNNQPTVIMTFHDCSKTTDYPQQAFPQNSSYQPFLHCLMQQDTLSLHAHVKYIITSIVTFLIPLTMTNDFHTPANLLYIDLSENSPKETSSIFSQKRLWTPDNFSKSRTIHGLEQPWDSLSLNTRQCLTMFPS